MKVVVEVDVDCCDDCPFLSYQHSEDVCVLAEDLVEFPSAFDTIHDGCPLLNRDKIKYCKVKVRK